MQGCAIETDRGEGECEFRRSAGVPAAAATVLISIAVLLGALDRFWVDLLPGWATLGWARHLFGAMSGNYAPGEGVAWIYLAAVATSLLMGVSVIRWYKALACGLAVPLLAALAYSMLGYATGHGINLGELLLPPLAFSWAYLLPSLSGSSAATLILSGGVERAEAPPPEECRA
jgi:hypothetical protein